MSTEADYQKHLIDTIEEMLPGSFVLKNDSAYLQGIPDLLVLYRGRWAMLEVKISERSPEQPNQAYYIDLFGQMSFGAFIFPENEEEVLDALQRSLKARGGSRIP